MSDMPAPKGLLGLSDSPEDAAEKLTAAIDSANAEAASPFNAMFEPPAPTGPETIGGIARPPDADHHHPGHTFP